MGWTPPSKAIVSITAVTMVFAIFILLDMHGLIWDSFLPEITVETYNVWLVIALVLVFLTWFLFYLGVRLSGI